jgi:hypothetical protein
MLVHMGVSPQFKKYSHIRIHEVDSYMRKERKERKEVYSILKILLDIIKGLVYPIPIATGDFLAYN